MTPPGQVRFFAHPAVKTVHSGNQPKAQFRQAVGGVITPPYKGYYNRPKAQAVARLCLIGKTN